MSAAYGNAARQRDGPERRRPKLRDHRPVPVRRGIRADGTSGDPVHEQRHLVQRSSGLFP